MIRGTIQQQGFVPKPRPQVQTPVQGVSANTFSASTPPKSDIGSSEHSSPGSIFSKSFQSTSSAGSHNEVGLGMVKESPKAGGEVGGIVLNTNLRTRIDQET